MSKTPEPLDTADDTLTTLRAPRNELLKRFVDECRWWHRWHKSHCWEAYQSIFFALRRRYGPDVVLRHQSTIGTVLKRAENAAAVGAGKEKIWDV